MAHLLVDKGKVSENYSRVLSRCGNARVSLLTVLKEGVARRQLLEHFFQAGLTRVGLAHYPAFPCSIPNGVEKVLLYLTPWSDLEAVVCNYDMSLQSDPETLKRLADAAERVQKKHRVLLVVEVGDQREGSSIEEAYEMGMLIEKNHASSLDLYGIAANFACLNDCLPSSETLLQLAACKNGMEKSFQRPLPILSVGGSDVLQWLAEGNALPPEVTEIRCGTAILLGTYPHSDTTLPDAHADAITLEAEVLECRKKNGRLRAVMDFGTLDTSPQDVKLPFEGMVFAGASSGYTVFDVTDCPGSFSTGTHVSFLLNFRSLSRAFLSPKLPMRTLK